MQIELSAIWGDDDASESIREIRNVLDVMIRLLRASGVWIRTRGLETVIGTPFPEQ